MQDALEHGDRLVLEALAAEGTRWHSPASLAAATGTSFGFVLSRLSGLRRRELATSRTTMAWTKEWSITTVGSAALQAGEQLRLA